MNEERLNKLLEDIDNALYDLKICQCNINVTAKGHKWETYYGLDDDLIKYIRKIESSSKNLQSKIDKANEILNKLCVVKPYESVNGEFHKYYRPIKNTTKQEVYKAICDLRDVLKEVENVENN